MENCKISGIFCPPSPTVYFPQSDWVGVPLQQMHIELSPVTETDDKEQFICYKRLKRLLSATARYVC